MRTTIDATEPMVGRLESSPAARIEGDTLFQNETLASGLKIEEKWEWNKR